VIAGGRLVGGSAGRKEQVAVEAVEVGVDEGLARLRGDGQTGDDRPLRVDELAGGLLRVGQEQEDHGRPGLVFRLGGEREACHDLGECSG
jgi:hypothetical protein